MTESYNHLPQMESPTQYPSNIPASAQEPTVSGEVNSFVSSTTQHSSVSSESTTDDTKVKGQNETKNEMVPLSHSWSVVLDSEETVCTFNYCFLALSVRFPSNNTLDFDNRWSIKTQHTAPVMYQQMLY